MNVPFGILSIDVVGGTYEIVFDKDRKYCTPRAADGYSPQGFIKKKSAEESKFGWSLVTQLRVEEADSDGNLQRLFLNPEWVEWLMGFPIGWTEIVNNEQEK